MLNLKKYLLASTFAMGMLAQTASADFYVIPVGQSSIPTSSVKSFSSSCVNNTQGTVALPYTVPENKAFVVASIVVSSCGDYSQPGLVEIGPNYKQYVQSSTSTHNNIYNYNVGIVMHAGEQIFLTNKIGGGGSSQGLMISINGYETRP